MSEQPLTAPQDVAPPGAVAEAAPPMRPDWLAKARTVLDAHGGEIELLAPLALYLAVAGVVTLGVVGLLAAVLVTAATAMFGGRVSPQTIVRLYRAQPISAGQGRALKAAVSAMAVRAGLPAVPELAIVPTHAAGAFSAGGGPRHVILLTEGLLRRHSLGEIVAVVAHEIGHIRSGHLPVFALADTITRLAQLLYYAGVALAVSSALGWLAGEKFIGFAPIAVLLAAPALNSWLQLSLSRQRDFDADRLAVHMLGSRAAAERLANLEPAVAGSVLDDWRWPVPQRRVPLPSPLRIHCDQVERARRLHMVALPDGVEPIVVPDEPLVTLVGVGPIEMRPRNRWPGLWF